MSYNREVCIYTKIINRILVVSKKSSTFAANKYNKNYGNSS